MYINDVLTRSFPHRPKLAMKVLDQYEQFQKEKGKIMQISFFSDAVTYSLSCFFMVSDILDFSAEGFNISNAGRVLPR